MTEHRICPLPFDKAQVGICRWCGEALTSADHRRRRWHAKCLVTYYLHSDLVRQRVYLVERDGHECAHCHGTLLRCRHGGWVYRTEAGDPYQEVWFDVGGEVDHREPLWKLIGVKDRTRIIWFFSPANLQLLCNPCRKAKSAAETTEREHMRRVRESHEGKPRSPSGLRSRGFDKRYTKHFDGSVTRRKE